MDALEELSSFFTENTLKSRRNPRREIERRNLQINHDFLDAFRTVKESADSARERVGHVRVVQGDAGPRPPGGQQVRHALADERDHGGDH